MPAGRWTGAVHRALRPPVRESRFWAVQAMVVGLAVVHLAADWASATPKLFPTGIPVALLLGPVSYAALRYGLAGSAATAMWATLLWLPDLLLPHDRGHVGADLTDLLLVVAVAVFVGYHIDSEHLARQQARTENERARRFAEMLVEVDEGERQRISRELHDEPLQLVVHLARSLERLDQVPQTPDTLAKGLEGAHQHALEAAARLRAIAKGLRPPALEQLGLVTALRGLLAEAAEAGTIRTDLDVTGAQIRLAPKIELAAFRIAQEAVNNVLLHAGATQVVLSLAFSQRGLRLCVADDGHGFEPAPPQAPPAAHPKGLLGMSERAALVAGQLTVRSRKGEGTLVEAVFPMTAADTS
jgi:signal transduction histidine kinase